MTTTGVIGLGSMGAGVARSLRRAGFAVLGCDPRAEALQALAADGVTQAASPAALARQAAVVLVLVVNAEQTEHVLFGPDGAAPALARGTLVIACSTVAPEFAERLAARLAERGILMLDAPISGGAAKAQEGALTVMASGEPAAFAAAESVLAAIAAKVYRLGDRAGIGSKVKMVNQLLAGVHIAAAAEAMALGIKAGADPATLYEVISNSAGSSWMFQNRVPHILAGDYSPRSAVDIFVKDLGIVLETARRLTFPAPLTAAAHQQFLAASAAGHGREDDAAVIKTYPGVSLPAAKS